MNLQSIVRMGAVAVFLMPVFSLAADVKVPENSHEHFSLMINNTIEWTHHIQDEVAKGKKMSVEHAKEEAVHLRGWLAEMSKSYIELSKQPLSEIQEGHFKAIKTRQDSAEATLTVLEAELAKSKQDLSLLKKTIKKIMADLKEASKQHEAELTEIEHKHK